MNELESLEILEVVLTKDTYIIKHTEEDVGILYTELHQESISTDWKDKISLWLSGEHNISHSRETATSAWAFLKSLEFSKLDSFKAFMDEAIREIDTTGGTDSFYGCSLDAESVDSILAHLDSSKVSGADIDIHSGTNGSPGESGLLSIISLANRGCTITINGED